MPRKDSEKRRRYDAAWQRDLVHARKAEWLAANPCACGAPATRIFAGPDIQAVPHGIFSYGLERRSAALAMCVPLCQPCSVKHPRHKPEFSAVNPAKVPAPKAPEVAAPLSINPRTAKAKQSYPKPVSDLQGDMEAAVKRADRRAWREKRREEQGYG